MIASVARQWRSFVIPSTPNNIPPPLFSRLYGQRRGMSTSAQDHQNDLVITDKCAQMIKKLQSRDWVKNKEAAKLRVAVEGGGCSGMQYAFTLDDSEQLEEDDIVFAKNGATLVVDKESLKHLKGSTIDWKEEMIRSSFVVSDNPNSATNCSCGVSFESKTA